MDLSSGAHLAQFILERQIGTGGMGTVWAARGADGGAPVALKILRVADPSTVDVLRARLLREARATRLIAHPAIVPVLDVLDYQDSPVLVMALLQGETLRQKLVREGRLTLPETARLLAPIAEALSVAHEAGIVHRDLKPENIFIEASDPSGSADAARVRLLDFGVARFYEPPEASDDAPLTGLGTLIGTLAYMAPEQALRPSECGHEVDVWALGIILYEALSGCRPIEGHSGPETMRQLLVGGITPLEVMMPSLPASVTELVSSMLRRTPERRPKDLRAIAETLLNYALAT
ncbi:MAG TPA: serine/threonine-protein kinase [Polyangiaceae bacterium]|nr:serine/threonine-protein kinase [Polyangiaceae bacterium]